MTLHPSMPFLVLNLNAYCPFLRLLQHRIIFYLNSTINVRTCNVLIDCIPYIL